MFYILHFLFFPNDMSATGKTPGWPLHIAPCLCCRTFPDRNQQISGETSSGFKVQSSKFKVKSSRFKVPFWTRKFKCAQWMDRIRWV